MSSSTVSEKKIVTNGKKSFEREDSILTELLKDRHFQTIRHFFYALLISYICIDGLKLFTPTQPTFGFKMLTMGFRNSQLGIILWIVMFLLHLTVFEIFRLWARIRQELSFTGSIKRSWDLMMFTLLSMYYIGSLYYVPVSTIRMKLAPLASIAIQLENLRLVMKAHSFVRNNLAKVIAYKLDTNQILDLPKFSHILYFSFAPTFLYQDNYCRTKKTNMRLVLKSLADFLCSIWLLGFVADGIIPYLHQDAGLIKINWIDIALSIGNNFLPGVFVFLTVFYLIYQCWLNITGELLRFANRKFYKAWWTSTDYGEFFRTWNTVVQDWLYVYIYKEFKDNLTPNSRIIPKLMVLFISALFHEYVTCCILNQFFPVMKDVWFRKVNTTDLIQASLLVLWTSSSNIVFVKIYCLQIEKWKPKQEMKKNFSKIAIHWLQQCQKELIVYFIQGKPTLFGFEPIIVGFANFPLGFLLWTLLFGSNVMVIPLLRVWAYARTEISPVSVIKRSCDIIALVALISYYTCCFYVLTAVGRKSYMGYLTAMVLHLENVRLMMQIHSVIRTVAPRVLRYKPHSDQTLELPTITKYLDYNLLPTLVYKDSYPRKKEINIKFAMNRFFEMFCMIWLMSFVYEKHYVNIFQQSGLTKIDWTHFWSSLFNNYICGAEVLFFLFFVLLHSYYNGMAELTKFADRQFYSDWWTSNDFGEFYRKWHSATQDWLYVYIYKDVKDHITPNSNVLPKLAVIFVSAVIHEYIILVILEQMFPMMFLFMIVSTTPSMFCKVKDPRFNILFHLNYGIAMNLLVHFYLMEHYTTLNCPPPKDDAFLQFIPRVFTADCDVK
ncbi:hypothetical protein Trydic_g4817 [Trypoxylus dichotomus]